MAKRAYHHGNLRAALVQATLRAIAEDGPDGFTLRDVARRAGVSPAAPYRHFTDKDELLAAVAGECAERLAAMVAAAVAEAPPDDLLAQFRQVGIANVEFAVAHPEHFRALNIPGIAARLPPEQRHGLAWHEEQRRALAAAQAAGAIAQIPLADLELAAGSLVHGLGHLIVEGQLGEVSLARAKELATAVTAVLGLGLLPRAPGDPFAAKSSAEPPCPPQPATSPSPRSPPKPEAALGKRAPSTTNHAPPSPPSSKSAPRKGMRDVRPKHR